MTDRSLYAVALAAQIRLAAHTPANCTMRLVEVAGHPAGCGEVTVRTEGTLCIRPLAPHVTGTPRCPNGHAHYTTHTAHVAGLTTGSLDWVEATATVCLQALATQTDQDHQAAASPHN